MQGTHWGAAFMVGGHQRCPAPGQAYESPGACGGEAGLQTSELALCWQGPSLRSMSLKVSRVWMT